LSAAANRGNWLTSIAATSAANAPPVAAGSSIAIARVGIAATNAGSRSKASLPSGKVDYRSQIAAYPWDEN